MPVAAALASCSGAEGRDAIVEGGYVVFLFMTVVLLMMVFTAAYIRRLNRQRAVEAENTNRIRKDFFTYVTHDFRTPLTIILGLSHDMGQSAELPPAARQQAGTIERHGKVLLKLTNQLLDIVKARSEIADSEWCRGDITTYVGMVVDGFGDFAKARGVNLRLASVENEITTDFVPDYVQKIVSNLLSNALKFTPCGGSVTVRLRKGSRHLHISVSDTGIGIPQDSMKYVFDPFYHTPAGEGSVGTGVGLTLVRQIVECLGGTISVRSRVGEGSSFFVSLPLVEGKARAAENGNSEPAEENMIETAETNTPISDSYTNDGGVRILVVEDNDDVGAYIGGMLEGRYAVFHARDGASGLEKARGIVPDLILTDLIMPGIDGLELCRKIRKSYVTSHIPIIVITAMASEDDRISGLRAGADAYMEKPFSAAELAVRIEKLLEQRRMLREKYASLPAGGRLMTTGNRQEGEFINRVNDCVYSLLATYKHAEVSSVAAMLCMSYTQFYRKMSAITGQTPAQYIQKLKVGKSQRLLAAHPEKSLSEVATLCGFSDYSNFVRAFKNVTGNTPSQHLRRTTPVET